MAIGGGGRGGPRSEINVTPLVDVALVLLIIFMVVTPMLQRGKSVELPRSRAVDRSRGGGDPLIVSLTADRRLWIGAEACDPEALEPRLRAEVAARPDRPILLKGDRAVRAGDVRRVMAAARRAGARAVRLAVDEVKEGAGGG